ncbi:GNAT family N-acetyltransferase [Klebsiella pneumoniae]
MKIRLAVPVEAEECWNIRNQAIRYGCKSSYDDAVIAAWTPEKMPESYRNAIVVNPFFVVAAPDGRLLATGYLDLSTGSIEAVFTLPQYTGKGLGSQIIEAIKSEARGRGFEQLTGFVNGMVASHLLCHSGTINRHSLNGALLS